MSFGVKQKSIQDISNISRSDFQYAVQFSHNHSMIYLDLPVFKCEMRKPLFLTVKNPYRIILLCPGINKRDSLSFTDEENVYFSRANSYLTKQTDFRSFLRRCTLSHHVFVDQFRVLQTHKVNWPKCKCSKMNN